MIAATVTTSDIIFSTEDVLKAIESSRQLEIFKEDLVRGGRTAVTEKKKGRVDLFTMDPADLKIVPMFNTRIDSPEHRAHIDDLKAKIRKHGFLKNHPISVFVQRIDSTTTELWVTDGNTRLEAVRELIAEGEDIPGVPVALEPEGTTLSDITARLVINNSGKQLNDLEIGLVLKRLISYGHELEDAAEMINIKPTRAENLLVLIGAPDAIRGMVISGELSATLAIQHLKEHGAKAVDILAKGLETAKALGKKKVTQKTLEVHNPAALMKRVVTKHAERMHQHITKAPEVKSALQQQVADDPAMASLSETSRAAIHAALEQLATLSTLVTEIQASADDLVSAAQKAASEAEAGERPATTQSNPED